jgi:hypothetical protein
MQLANFRTAPPTPPPPAGNVSHDITDWGMDGNDQWSDCGGAMADHYIVAKTGNVALIDKLGGIGTLPMYWKYGLAQGETGTPPAQPDQPDQGVDNPTWFTFLMDMGVIDAWCELPLNDPVEIHAAMLNFSGVCVQVTLTDDANDLFNQHLPWTLANGETPDPNEGHDILLVEYGPQGYCFVTWGALQWATIPWDNSCITGVYVFVSKEDAARNGVDINALIATIRQFNGTVATIPGGTP